MTFGQMQNQDEGYCPGSFWPPRIVSQRALLLSPSKGGSLHDLRSEVSFGSRLVASPGSVSWRVSCRIALADSHFSLFRAAVLVSTDRIALFLTPLIYVSSTAEQGARANAGICHASCDRKHFEMKPQKVNRSPARGAPAPIVAHL
jgi:hypothetical protein